MKTLLAGVLFLCMAATGLAGEFSLHVRPCRIPLLAARADNPVLIVRVCASDRTERFSLKRIAVRFTGVKGISDLEGARVYAGVGKETFPVDSPFCGRIAAGEEMVFNGNMQFVGEAVLWVSVGLKARSDPDNLFLPECLYVETDREKIEPERMEAEHWLRPATVVRHSMQDGVHTCRIPGLVTTSRGTLLAIYDVRHDSSRDIQGNIDVGLSRSTDGGRSWEPMRTVLDMGEYGGLPQKFNGVGDACILADEKTGKVFVAGVWMHGLLDDRGRWMEGLTESSAEWRHQWRGRASQSGYSPRRTCQFMMVESVDDGLTWSRPRNITRQGKKRRWWLWAPAPGRGIVLGDGTLVMPVQGRDGQGKSFSTISLSENGGRTWRTGNPAFEGTTECAVVQLENGDIMLNCRYTANRNRKSPNGRVVMVTSDRGRTWREHSTSRRVLTEPVCMASLHRPSWTEDGRERSILLFANPDSWQGRRNMTVKVSFDDGKTWPRSHWILLDELKSRGYSCLTSVDEHTIGILYESSQAQITFQRISLDEILKR